MTDALILVGGGGHCKACIDVIETTGLSIAGILDRENHSETLLRYKVIGTDEELKALARQPYVFLVAVGQTKSSEIRKALFQKIKSVDGKLATVAASTAIVSQFSSIGEGTIVMHHALINADTRIGVNCIINSKALIEHDCIIGDHTHISTAAVVNGGCKVGAGVFVGSNAVVAHGIEISDNVVIGAGAVVIKNILEPGVYAGNPARRIHL